jgi:hypothetical protein
MCAVPRSFYSTAPLLYFCLLSLDLALESQPVLPVVR